MPVPVFIPFGQLNPLDSHTRLIDLPAYRSSTDYELNKPPHVMQNNHKAVDNSHGAISDSRPPSHPPPPARDDFNRCFPLGQMAFSEMDLAKENRDIHIKGLLSVLSGSIRRARDGCEDFDGSELNRPDGFCPEDFKRDALTNAIRLPHISYVLQGACLEELSSPISLKESISRTRLSPHLISSSPLSPHSRAALFAVDSSAYTRICEPLSRWIACHLWQVVTTGLSVSQDYLRDSHIMDLPFQPLPVLAESICSLLLSTLLQPSVIIQSLYYISRLPAYIGPCALDSNPDSIHSKFRSALTNVDATPHNDPVTKALYSSFKLFVVGAILGNKVLDDHVFTLKTWHEVSGIPLSVLNRLEWMSLNILDHNLHMEFYSWMHWVRSMVEMHLGDGLYGSLSSQLDLGARRVLRYTLHALLGAKARVSCSRSSREPVFLGLDDRLADASRRAASRTHTTDFELDDNGPLREEYLPKCPRYHRRDSEIGAYVHHLAADSPSPEPTFSLDDTMRIHVSYRGNSSPLTPLDASSSPCFPSYNNESGCYLSSSRMPKHNFSSVKSDRWSMGWTRVVTTRDQFLCSSRASAY